MELANGIKNITVAHSAFRVLDFNVLNTRRVMLTVKRPDGSWLPKGTSIVDEKITIWSALSTADAYLSPMLRIILRYMPLMMI